MVITPLLIQRGWNLRDFSDCMQSMGWFLGREYHWCWHRDQWAVQCVSPDMLTMMTLYFGDCYEDLHE